MYFSEDSDNYSLYDYVRNKNDNRFKVFGNGTVSVIPDAAEVIIGVITENVELEVAQQENAKITLQVINGIKEMGVLPRYIQTQDYSIRPNYDYIEGKQVFRGYVVNNNLKIQIKNIDSIGAIIDNAVKNGANNVGGINFIVSDISKHYYDALALAIEDAQNKARVMANELNVKLNLIPILINEQQRGNISPLVMTLKNTSVTTPVEAGENKITADIEAVFLYTE